MLSETLVADHIAELALDAAKDRISEKIDKSKLKTALVLYTSRQHTYNELCSHAEEIDFQGLVDYIRNDLLDDVGKHCFDPDEDRRELSKGFIISKAVKYSCAEKPEAKERVEKCIKDCLEIIYKFYNSKLNEEDYIYAGIIVGAVNKKIEESNNDITVKIEQKGNEVLAAFTRPHGKEKIAEVNKRYADEYNKTLFLHDDPRVTLKNLFIWPDYQIFDGQRYVDAKIPLEECISNFVNKTNEGRRKPAEKIMIIEGDAGIGKSSIFYRLNAGYPGVYNNRPIITVRLRDIDEDECINNGLFVAIMKYFDSENMGILTNMYQNALFFLDGFDELCLIHKKRREMRNPYFIETLLSELNRLTADGIKVIITSRLNCIPYLSDLPDDISFTYQRLRLEHFDEVKRETWVENFTTKCGQKIEDNIREYIIENPYEICDTPFMLYMLASKEIKDVELKHEWAIFNQVFHETTFMPKYNEKFVDEKGRGKHPGIEYSEVIYRVNEEIAYSMYRSNNENFHVDSNELKEIINKLADNAPKLAEDYDKEIVEHSYALCSYWKTNSEKGAVEFYHNNIRDFFMCEKIFREINSIYRKYGCFEESTVHNYETRKWIENAKDEVIVYLCDLFQYHTINETVLKYMMSRVKYKATLIKLDEEEKGIIIKDMDDNTYDYPFREKTRKMFPAIIEKLLLMATNLTKYPSDNPIQKIANIVSAIFSVYVYPCSELLQKDEYLSLWKEVNKVNSNPFFRNLISSGCFQTEYLSHTDLSFINLSGVHMDHVKLTNVNLDKAHLENSTWIGAELKETSMRGVHLEEAYLNSAQLNAVYLDNAHMEKAGLVDADLYETNMNGADLRNADLTDVRLFNVQLEKSTLIGVKFNRAHMEHIHLKGADLRDADLRETHLTGADFRDARLEKTILPNGVRCAVQNKQIECLKRINITGLQI